MKCADCMYCQTSTWRTKDKTGMASDCELTHRVIFNALSDIECPCFNLDLSQYDICYNCKYYRGGGDWGLFCSHKDMYHHLGKFNDVPCERYEKKKVKR